MPPQPPLEIPIFTPASAAHALAHGADRLELNAPGSYAAGGLTPPASLAAALAHNPVPLRIMIRPRARPPSSADFVYTPDELGAMARAIGRFRASGTLRAARGDGFVFGVLRKEEEEEEEEQGRPGPGLGLGLGLRLDVRANAALVAAAGPFACVLHRAFDDVVAAVVGAGGGGSADVLQGRIDALLADVRRCGFGAVLTSGGAGDAPGNVEMLERIGRAARSEAGHVEIIVGGGVRSRNVLTLATRLAATGSRLWYHSSCIRSDGSDEADESEILSLKEQLQRVGHGVVEEPASSQP